MKPTHILLILVLSAVLAFATASFVGGGKGGGQSAQSVVKETRLEQVKRTGVLRCGYLIWPPFNTKDPNTGKMGGFYYDLLEEMGRQLKLKIEWTRETSTASMLSDLSMNRYDMVCAPVGRIPGRAREADFTTPVLYSPIYMYVRQDDTRFDQDFERANQPDVTFAIMDGEFSSVAANENFPKAKQTSVLQLLNSADLYMAVAGKKADAVVQDPFTFEAYNKNNPGVLRAAGNKPLRVLSAGIPLPANEPAFKAMLDTTLDYLLDSGFVEKLCKKYEGNTRYFRPAKHYQE